jgi:hypothetical protein
MIKLAGKNNVIKRKTTTMPVRITLSMYLLIIALHGQAQSVWHLSKENQSIKVYTKKNDSAFYKSIKVEGVFEGSWEKLRNILMDVKHHEQWVYHTKEAYLVKKVSSNEVLYHTETSLPWPMNNRDAVIRMKLSFDPGENMGRVLSRNEPDFLPAIKGLVRIPYYKAIWEVKLLEKNKIAITYFLDIQPGGALPAWVVNMFISTGPYETFSKLAELLKK